MRVRVEVRRARRKSNPNPRRFPRVASSHLRGLLILDNRTRVVLATVALPIMGDADVAALVKGSEEKIRQHVSNEGLVEGLLATLAAQAEVHRQTPQERARQLAKHQKLRDRLKELAGVLPR